MEAPVNSFAQKTAPTGATALTLHSATPSTSLGPRSWWQEQGPVPVADWLFLQEQLWLLLPQELQAPAAAKATLRVIQRRALRAAARGAGALLGLEGSFEEGVGAGERAAAGATQDGRLAPWLPGQ